MSPRDMKDDRTMRRKSSPDGGFEALVVRHPGGGFEKDIVVSG